MDEASVKQVVAENNRELLPQIRDLVKTSISDFKRSNETIVTQQMSEIKRLKRDSVPRFNKKSNKEQYNVKICRRRRRCSRKVWSFYKIART